MISPPHKSIVSTKYGDRPLIDVRPISFDLAPRHYHQRGNSNIADYNHGPANNFLPRLPPLPPPRPQYTTASYGYNQSPQPQPQWSNQVHSTNIVPYSIPNQPPPPPPPPQPLPPQPAYPANNMNYLPPVQNFPPVQNYAPPVGQPTGGEGEVHHFYGPSGERLPGPPQPTQNNYFQQSPQRVNRLPSNFRLEGTLEYGRMATVEVKESNISFRDLPDYIIKDLKKMYGHFPKTQIKIIGEHGEFNIYGTPIEKHGEIPYKGYLYNKPRTTYTGDPYTKKYDDFGHQYPHDYREQEYYRGPVARAQSLPPVSRHSRVDDTMVRRPIPRPVRYD